MEQSQQTFAAWVTKILDVKKHERNTSELKAELWISRNRIPHNIKQKIMRYVRLRLQEGKDVDVGNLLPILPFALGMAVKKHLCFPILKTVSQLNECLGFDNLGTKSTKFSSLLLHLLIFLFELNLFYLSIGSNATKHG